MVIAIILAACAQPEPIAPSEAPAAESGTSAAAEEEAATTPDQIVPGGIWTRAALSDATILNPILSSETASSGVWTMLFPGLIGQDHVTGEIVPEGSISESWEVSEDGLTWTFHLRDGLVWSDGDPLDAADFKFTYDAIASDNVETPRKSNVESIASIETPDPLTVVVTFKELKCDGLTDLGLGLLPSHLYADDFSDIMENEYNTAPPVSAGPFVFQSWARDDNIVLVRNESYWEGAPHMEGMIYKVIPEPGARLAQLQSGEVDVIGVQPEQIASVDADANLLRYNFQDDGYDYIGLNLANPENPQPGRDEDGNLIPQDPHPILGELAVRQAIAHSLDYQTIIDQVYLGQGYQIAANVLPAVPWAFDDTLAPYEYDPELAAQILEEAGWVDSDGDGVREKDGNTLTLALITNAGNTTREDLGVLVQDQLTQVGFQINYEVLEFGTVVENILGQTYDMVIIGWTGLGSDPNDDGFWHTNYDTPGSGFNFVSYQNPEVDSLLEQGLSVVGCATEERAPFYKEIQQHIHNDIPYVFISGGVGNIGYTNKWEGIDPGPISFYWNVHTWRMKSLQP
jgi:peptide/nickel transport system substrate-binding protein